MAEQSRSGQMPESHRVAQWLRATGRALWPLLVLLALAYVTGVVLGRLSQVVIPVVVAVLLAALLHPLVRRLTRLRLPRWLASALVLLGAFGVLGGVVVFAVNGLLGGVADLGATLADSLRQLRQWLLTGPLGLDQAQLDRAVDNLTEWVRGHADRLAANVTATASATGQFLSGLLLTLFVLFFLLYQGDRIWHRLLRAVPADARPRTGAAGEAAFSALSGYARATVAVAAADAVAMGIGLALIGVPLVVPLASLVFLGGFVPYIGAFVSGLAAVLVALVAGGPVDAALVVALSVAVQTLEGNVLQPLLLGGAIRLHPLAIVLAVAAGTVLLGITGALLAVPALAVARAAITSSTGKADP